LAEVNLGFGRGGSEVRRNDYVILAEKRAFRGRFFGKNSRGRAGDFFLGDGFGQQVFVNQAAAGAVDNADGGFISAISFSVMMLLVVAFSGYES